MKAKLRQLHARALKKLNGISAHIRYLFRSPKCKVCSGKTYVKKAYGRVFFRCWSCDFVFAVDFVPESLKKGMGMEGSWSGPGGGGYREYYLVKMLARDLKLNKFLLFGTGNTPTFENLVKEGVDVVGCDISPDVVLRKRKEFGNEKFFFPDEIPQDAAFDGIIAVEVFEHLAEPRNTLELLLSRLNRGGVICGTTDFYQGGEIEDGNTPGYMSLKGHVAYWSIHSLRHLCSTFNCSVSAFEMVRPGSVLIDEKYGQLYPNKRVFFIFDPHMHRTYFDNLQRTTPILPIDRP